MHELSIAQSIMQIVLSEAEKAKARRVVEVTLRVGDLETPILNLLPVENFK